MIMQPDFAFLKRLYNSFDPFRPLPAGDPAYVDCKEVRGDGDILLEVGREILYSDRMTCQLYAGHLNLNQQRERFRDNFNICFVFLLPIFAIKYFIQRAPDFFDWRSGLFEFPIDSKIVEQESLRILQDGDYEKYLSLTPEERTR